jgi:diacylglycerol kinase family enzyme
MTRLTKLRHYNTRVEYDGGVFEGDLCFGGVANSTSVAGLVRLDDDLVSLSDGKFEIILIKTPKNVIDLNRITSGVLSRNYDNNFVTVLQSSRVTFTFEEPVAWTRDGENGGEHTSITLECMPCHHRIIVDK